jgi:16S rRNA (cytosine1402-N4)-methyltransferase
LDEHTPVLVEEALAALALRPGGLYVDATFGRGGHTARILEALGPDGQIVAIDRDPAAIAAGRTRFAHEPRLHLVHGEFAALATLVRTQTGRTHCDGALFDFGVASPQLDDAARGFSFSKHVIATLGEERFAGRIAAEIVRVRDTQPLTRTSELAALVARSVRTRQPGKHPATRTFQALRMHINDELGQMQSGLEQALQLLAPRARLVAISFHSLEDRLVKQFIRAHSELDPVLARLPRPPASAEPPLRRVGSKQRAGADELAANPRARSAVLRVAERRA